MKIIFDSQWISEKPTGIGRVSLNWIKGLLKYERNFEYLLIGQERNRPQLLRDAIDDNEKRFTYKSIAGWKLAFVPDIVRKILWEQCFMSSFLKKERGDIIHFLWFNIPLTLKGNVVITIHDMDLWLSPKRYTRKFRLYYKGIISHWVRHAKAIITVSENSKKDIIFTFRVKPEMVHVIYNYVDQSIFKPQSRYDIAAVLSKYGVENDYFLYSGGLGIRKNLKRLLEAYAIYVSRASCPVDLIIIGGGNEIAEDLKGQVNELNLSRKVCFTGYVKGIDVPPLYSGAKAVIYPSLYEGFGFPIVEAMSCGTPVVTSNISSMPEIAGDAAMLVNPLNVEEISAAMEKVCNDDTLREDLKSKGARRAAFFNEKESIEKLIEVYKLVGAS